MTNDYLWDGSGPVDPDVERLEQLLTPFGLRRPRRRWLAPVAVAAGLLLAAVLGWMLVARVTAPAHAVEVLAGAPRLDGDAVGGGDLLRTGSWLETDSTSRARVQVADIGRVDVEPRSRLTVLRSRGGEHRLRLGAGAIRARTTASPRQFFVETPAGVAVDLGCEFELRTDERGDGSLTVRSGWVAFETEARDSIVPAGGQCSIDAEHGPGIPWRVGASPELRRALTEIARGRHDSDALQAALEAAGPDDGLSLWHLLPTWHGGERERIVDRMTAWAPLPESVDRDAILRLEHGALSRWQWVLQRRWRERAE